ncbi:MAG: glycosyltransferase family 39 protein, partial [Planctomycetaceae bacterium]|nr:glycosyltransferase family 39 protein [Planctomycetaceae bacterium]
MREPRLLWGSRWRWSYEQALLVAAALLFGVCLGSNRALTDHEALLAGSAKQMVLEGDWLLLRIGDQPWLEKPPLPQWLAASCALAFGRFHEWTMRLPFACAGVLVVLIITRLMTTLFGREVGLLAGFVQATSVYQVAYARLAESDVILQVFVLGAITVFQELETRRDELSAVQQSRLRLAFWILLGCTNLAKGLAFGAVLTLLTCGGWLLLRRDWAAWRRWWSPLGMALALAIAAAWPLA